MNFESIEPSIFALNDVLPPLPSLTTVTFLIDPAWAPATLTS